MPNDEMYQLVCKDRFDKIDEKLDNHIPTLIRNQFRWFVGIMSPFVLGILWLLISLLRG